LKLFLECGEGEIEEKFGLKHKGKRNTPEVLNKINIAHGRQ
jgi:hypothetical protein